MFVKKMALTFIQEKFLEARLVVEIIRDLHFGNLILNCQAASQFNIYQLKRYIDILTVDC